MWYVLMLVFVPFVQLEYSNPAFAENLVNTPCTDQNHFLLAPGVLTAGSSNRVCVSRFYTEGVARLLLSLVTEDGQTITAEREFLAGGDGGCLDISVPLLPNTKTDLVTSVTYPEQHCSWERRVTLRIASGRVVVVHTERARYRPGETVRARIFALKADLAPAHGTIEEIWIEGPPGAWEGTRVAQWTGVRSKMGLAQVQHEIDELAPPGRWTVRARLRDGSQGKATFTVGNYELPPFQLTVRTAPRVLRTSERLVWTVCVRYPWSEAVEGMLVIRLRGADSPSVGIRTAVRLRAPRACHRHAAAARRMGLMGDRPPSVVVADFSFQEDGTRVWQNTTVVSQIVDKPISLEFITKSKVVVTPSLPYNLKVKATRWDDKPAVNERIQICRYPSNSNSAEDISTCNSGVTGPNGVARVFFTAEHHGSPLYRFEANLANDTSVSAVPITIATRQSKVQAALGPLQPDLKGSRTFVPLYLSLQSVTKPLTVHFVVITRGGIIYRWGATTQCPTSTFANYVPSRNSQCYEALPLTDDTNSILEDSSRNRLGDYVNKITRRQRLKNQNDRNNKRFNRARSFNDRDTESVVINKNQNQNFNDYYSRYMSQINKSANGVDINKNQSKSTNFNSISDSFNANTNSNDKYTEVNEKSSNDVHSFDDVTASDTLQDRHLLRIMLPIKVTQQMCPDSHLLAYFYHNGEFVSAGKHFQMDDCFVNKVDLTWPSRQALPGATTALQVSVQGPALCALTVLDTAAKWTPVETVKDIIVSSLKRMMDTHRNLTEYDTDGDCFLNEDNPETPTNSLELTATWLAAAGIRAIGDMPLRRQCKPAAMMMSEEPTVPRSDFSESWLWRLVTVGANNSMTTMAKAPDSITRFEANAVCLTKTGVSVSQPAVLQVFREFFIHADSPRRLSRGDTTIIRYRLFNYLYQPLSVQIQILTDPHLQSSSDLVESVCIPPRSSNARRVEIKARGEGEGRVFIRAKAVSDGGCGTSGTYDRGVSDEVVIKIKVEPEGVPVHEQKSALLCGQDARNFFSSKSEVSWSWTAKDAVPGTESLTVWAISNITGPLLADADSLVLLPRGCGEQNMARLATNLLALSHLHPTCAAAGTAREHVSRGYNRQLQYIHPSGGFSAFGLSDPAASTWLTAFTVRYLRRAHQMLWPGLPIPPAIIRAEEWLLNQQMENGCFRNEGQVFHSEFTGGLDEEGETASVALTAYVITSLIEGASPLPRRIVINTLSCLRALPPIKRPAPYRVYAHSLLAYTFMRLKRYEEEIRRHNEASWLMESLKEHEGLLEVMELIKLGVREDDYLWWQTNSLSTSIEATSYALLALKESPISLQEYGAGAVRWLAAHRSATGGFISTQDTLVALEALSAWSSFQQVPANLTVSAASSNRSSTVELQAGMTVPEVMKMEGDSVKIRVQGIGCALIQATRSYNTLLPDPAGPKKLSVQLQVDTDGEFDCDATGSCYCAAVVEACVLWNGQFPEMALLEVTLPGGYEADARKLYSQLNQSDSMLRRIELSASSSRITFYLTSQQVGTGRHACLSVHCVGARAETMPAHVRVSDYYRPSVNDTQIYTIPENCPPRIAHETSQDMKDNVYSKARSLSQSGEILISRDYDIDDIPEVIPLDDPLYDNLRRKNSKEFTNTNNTVNSDDDIRTQNSSESNEETEISKEIKMKYDNENKHQKAEFKDVVIDDRLELNFDQKITANNNVEVQKTESFKINQLTQNEPTQENVNIISTESINNKIHDNNLYYGLSTETGAKIENIISVEDTIKAVTEPHHLIRIRDQHENNKQIENPSLTDFHVIDSEKDLEVPTGVEGPVPAVVLPPPNFVPILYDTASENSSPTPQNYAEYIENYGKQANPSRNAQGHSMLQRYEGGAFEIYGRDFVNPQHFAYPPRSFAPSSPPKLFSLSQTSNEGVKNTMRRFHLEMPERRIF